MENSDELCGLVDKINGNHPLKDILGALTGERNAATIALMERLSGWFDEGTGRVFGWYKWKTELWHKDIFRTQIAVHVQAAAQIGEAGGRKYRITERAIEWMEGFLMIHWRS